MIDLIGKHGSENGMTQMIVALITGKESIQMLNGMVDVFLCGDPLVVAVLERFAILLRAVLCRLCCSEHCMRRQKVKGIRRGGLLAAMFVLYDGRIRLDALNDLLHSISSIFIADCIICSSQMSASKSISLHDSIRPASRKGIS